MESRNPHSLRMPQGIFYCNCYICFLILNRGSSPSFPPPAERETGPIRPLRTRINKSPVASGNTQNLSGQGSSRNLRQETLKKNCQYSSLHNIYIPKTSSKKAGLLETKSKGKDKNEYAIDFVLWQPAVHEAMLHNDIFVISSEAYFATQEMVRSQCLPLVVEAFNTALVKKGITRRPCYVACLLI